MEEIKHEVKIQALRSTTPKKDIIENLIDKLPDYFTDNSELRDIFLSEEFYYIWFKEVAPAEKGCVVKGGVYVTDKERIVNITLLEANGWLIGLAFQKVVLDDSFDDVLPSLFEVNKKI